MCEPLDDQEVCPACGDTPMWGCPTRCDAPPTATEHARMIARHSDGTGRVARPIGRWVVVYWDGAWTSNLWGGDGEHPADGAAWPTWREAYTAALLAASDGA